MVDRKHRIGALLAAVVLLAAACSTTRSTSPAPSPSSSPVTGSPSAAVSWPAPPDPMDRTVAAGLKPQPKEFLTNHVHAHLDVFVNGQHVEVPAGIGIATSDPAVKSGPIEDGSMAYGGIDLCNQPCISPLHTHDHSGILHTESASAEPNTLGEFFTEWGVPLSATCVGNPCGPTPVAIYLDGQPFSGDPTTIKLTDHLEIAVVLGTPPATIPSSADFSNA